jgi:hypothetical protein
MGFVSIPGEALMSKAAVFLVLVLASLTAPAAAGDAPSRHVIDGVEPMEGPDPFVKAFARIVRTATGSKMTDDYLYGVSGAAFLATVCSNNCTCRDYRELVNQMEPTLTALGLTFEHFEGNDPAIWDRIRASIDDGVPVLAWNLFGDFEDSLLTGYDEEKDRVYGWGVAPAGDEYHTGSLESWRSGGMYGFIVERGAKEVDAGKIERERLTLALEMAHRAPLEGG